mmetsp:Transcript_11333/g.21748  ORF Transcript_11333/g.21748 Transcript_11333/m.21748 type:complete len:321 (-) Transcript_11333:162-1124(-)
MLEEACMRRIVKPKRLMMFRMISYDRYAACCMEFDIDGAIMAEANVDLLVELGFIKIHAHKVVQSIKKLTQSDSPQPCVSMILPLTEKEGKRMMKFGELYEVITEGEKKAMEALTRVTEEKKAARQQAKKIFTLLKEKVEAEELRCIAAIEKDHSTICAGLNKIIDQLRTNRLESKAKEKEINAASRISDCSQKNPADAWQPAFHQTLSGGHRFVFEGKHFLHGQCSRDRHNRLPCFARVLPLRKPSSDEDNWKNFKVGSKVAPDIDAEEEEDDANIDDEGLDTDEINTIMSQTRCSKAAAVGALKKKGNIVDAILALTP